jgi:hypothetical protein
MCLYAACAGYCNIISIHVYTHVCICIAPGSTVVQMNAVYNKWHTARLSACGTESVGMKLLSYHAAYGEQKNCMALSSEP